MIFVDEGLWRLGCVTDGRAQVLPIASPDDADIPAKVQLVAEQIAEQGEPGPVVLALPSHWCLSATIDTHELSRSNRRQAMRYLLEEHLPISAEDSVADFIERQGVALGVAIELERLRPIVEAFQELGIPVQAICPSALLACSGLIEQHREAAAVAIQSREGIDLVEIQRGCASRWWCLSDASELRDRLTQLGATLGEEAGQLVTLDVSEPMDALNNLSATSADASDVNADQLATLQAEQVLAGGASAWIDLRRDALQAPERYQLFQKQFGIVAAAITFFLVCVIGATYWRGEQYKAYADQKVSEQIGVFKSAMPGQRVPSSIISRLQSEQRRLAGISGQSGSDRSEGVNAMQPTSALTQMHTVLTAWPNSLRYRISDLTIEPNLVRINGQAADSVIPEKLAAALRATGAYQVDPPNTRALSEFGFTFGFIARPAPRNDEQTALSTEPGL